MKQIPLLNRQLENFEESKLSNYELSKLKGGGPGGDEGGTDTPDGGN